MSMDAVGQIAGHRGHFDRQYTFRDQFAGPDADNAHTQHALRDRFDQKFRQSIRSGQC